MSHDSDKQHPRKDETSKFLRAWAWKREHRYVGVRTVSICQACSSSCAVMQARQVSGLHGAQQKVSVLQIPTVDKCCRVRFNRPYVHSMVQPSTTLTLKQSKFDAEGFASTGIRLNWCSNAVACQQSLHKQLHSCVRLWHLLAVLCEPLSNVRCVQPLSIAMLYLIDYIGNST